MTYTADSLIEMVGLKAAEKVFSKEALANATVVFADGMVRVTSEHDGVAVQAKTEIGTDVAAVLAVVASALNEGDAPVAPTKATAKKAAPKPATKVDPDPEPTPEPTVAAEEPAVPPTVDDFGADDEEEEDENF